MEPSRRTLLASLAASASLAGCLGGGSGAEPTAATTTTPTETATATPTATETATSTPTATPTATPVPDDVETVTVELASSDFQPVRLSVDGPVRVEWVNRDGYPHNVKSAQFHDAATGWDYFSGNYGEGESASYVFTEPGIYEYFCTIHGTGAMCGVVLVGDVVLDEPLPCE
jgi:plastocyanin